MDRYGQRAVSRKSIDEIQTKMVKLNKKGGNKKSYQRVELKMDNQNKSVVNKRNYQEIESEQQSWESVVSGLEKWKTQKDINKELVEEMMRVDHKGPSSEENNYTQNKKYMIDSNINYRKIERIMAMGDEKNLEIEGRQRRESQYHKNYQNQALIEQVANQYIKDSKDKELNMNCQGNERNKQLDRQLVSSLKKKEKQLVTSFRALSQQNIKMDKSNNDKNKLQGLKMRIMEIKAKQGFENQLTVEGNDIDRLQSQLQEMELQEQEFICKINNLSRNMEQEYKNRAVTQEDYSKSIRITTDLNNTFRHTIKTNKLFIKKFINNTSSKDYRQSKQVFDNHLCLDYEEVFKQYKTQKDEIQQLSGKQLLKKYSYDEKIKHQIDLNQIFQFSLEDLYKKMINSQQLVFQYGIVYFYVKQYNLRDWQNVMNNNKFKDQQEKIFIQSVVNYQAQIEFLKLKNNNQMKFTQQFKNMFKINKKKVDIYHEINILEGQILEKCIQYFKGLQIEKNITQVIEKRFQFYFGKISQKIFLKMLGNDQIQQSGNYDALIQICQSIRNKDLSACNQKFRKLNKQKTILMLKRTKSIKGNFFDLAAKLIQMKYIFQSLIIILSNIYIAIIMIIRIEKMYLLVVLFSINQIVCFNYKQLGQDWTGICSTGQEQSPINIETGLAQYQAGSLLYLSLSRENSQSLLSDKLTTIQMDGKWLTFFYSEQGGGTLRAYTAQQFHFHSSSEHTIDSKRYSLEMHIVCNESESSRQINKNNPRNIGVLTILFDVQTADNEVFNMIDFQNKNSTMDVNMYKGFYDQLFALQNKNESLKYFTYPGSLTTPLCPETVDFYIIEQPLSIGQTQLDNFRTILNNDQYFSNQQGNYRLIQPLNARTVKKGTVLLPTKGAMLYTYSLYLIALLLMLSIF